MHAPLRPRSGLGWSGCHPRFGIRLAHSGGCCWRRHVSQTLQIILMQPELLKSPRLSQPFPTAPSLPSCPATTTPFLQVSALISSCGWIFRIPPFLIQHTFYLRSPVPSALFNVLSPSLPPSFSPSYEVNTWTTPYTSYTCLSNKCFHPSSHNQLGSLVIKSCFFFIKCEFQYFPPHLCLLSPYAGKF